MRMASNGLGSSIGLWRSRWVASTMLVSAMVLSAACETKQKTVYVDDDDGRGGAGASGVSSGQGAGGATGGEGCDGLCAKVAAAGCENDSQTGCLSECEGIVAMAPACSTEVDALLACQNDADIMCVDGEAQVSGCDAEGAALFACLQGGSGGGGSGGGGPAGACYDNAGDCNPLVPGSCPPDQACDMANDNQFRCFPPPNTQGIGASCDPASGPYCAHGGTCVANTCAAFCCEQADCSTGTCTDIGSVGAVMLRACS